ncbi:MAG: magnesium/cobalt transporter CorA [Parvularculaceae bacterium]|nr:magnesium/cobalt transporter CorA [Parvularculaceae bacterium]
MTDATDELSTRPSSLRLFSARDQKLFALAPDAAAISDAIWIDVLRPSPDAEQLIERALTIEVPTQEEMREIEVSSRLYMDGDGAFMTAMVLSRTDGDDVVNSPITFILAGARLITVRYEEPRVFNSFADRAQRTAIGCADAEGVLMGLLEAIIDRLADVLERLALEIDALSREIFSPAKPGRGKKRNRRPRSSDEYQRILEAIGRKYNLASNIRDSLVTFERLGSFFMNVAQQRKSSRELSARIKSFSRDTGALSEHVDSISQKITFLLDATLGMVNIEQNTIIKIFSVAATIFLPPTLIASIYGMNFDFMPELAWPFGYPFAICLMIVSAILPYLFFKQKGWL